MRPLLSRLLPALAAPGIRRRPTGSGVCGAGYHAGRQTKASLRYRLRRRTDEVVRCARRYAPIPIRSILDVGTADGLMLGRLASLFPTATALGLDLSRELLRASTAPPHSVVLADAQQIPVQPKSCDLVVATAVIEHVPEPGRVLSEVAACLRSGGVLVMTAPDPFWERLATMVGHLEEEQHHQVMELDRLTSLCEGAGLRVLEASKFMLSPVGMPLELEVERWVRRLGLDFLFANQLIAARKPW